MSARVHGEVLHQTHQWMSARVRGEALHQTRQSICCLQHVKRMTSEWFDGDVAEASPRAVGPLRRHALQFQAAGHQLQAVMHQLHLLRGATPNEGAKNPYLDQAAIEVRAS